MADYWIDFRETGERIRASADRTVLESARAGGVTIVSSCRDGTCRTCVRRLEAGEVTYRIEWPGLLPEEKQQGWFLPCVAYPAADLVVAGVKLGRWPGMPD